MNKKICILDFSTAIVYIKEIPQHLQGEQAEDVMEYFADELDIRESDCEYMMGDLTINQE